MTYQETPPDPAALADASTDADAIEEDKCAAWGPHEGECCRDRGHRDGAWDQGVHVTYDHDRYQDWPVGWQPMGVYARAVVEAYRKIQEKDNTVPYALAAAILAMEKAL